MPPSSLPSPARITCPPPHCLSPGPTSSARVGRARCVASPFRTRSRHVAKAARGRQNTNSDDEGRSGRDAKRTLWWRRVWWGWWTLPVPPTPDRSTVLTELVPRQVYGFDQPQGVLKVLVNVRMTAVVLREGGLLVNNPVAPTTECLDLLRSLVDRHGPVRHITLSSAALEHKSYFAPFARNFPSAALWAAPGQWSFPLNLPFAASIWPRRLAGYLTDTDSAEGRCQPWAAEVECAVLGVGGSLFTGFARPWFVDVALLHKATGTLLVTDAVCQVPLDPVPIFDVDPSPLLLRACDEPGTGGQVPDTPGNRRRGWWRVCLFAAYVVPTTQKSESLAYDGFRWEEGWEETFLCFAGRLVVHPILRVLCFNRRPREVLAWADKVARWDIARIVPGHYEAPIAATGRDFRAAFSFLEEPSAIKNDSKKRDETPLSSSIVPSWLRWRRQSRSGAYFPEKELGYLRRIDATAVARGTSEPPAVYTGKE